MGAFTIIAQLINKLLSFSFLPQLSIGASTPAPVATPDDVPQAPTQPPTALPGARSLITIPEVVTAHFYDNRSPAWKNQKGTDEHGKYYTGIHFGNDFSAPMGSAVYAPFPMTIISKGHYSDGGRMGDYVIGNLENGIQLYMGHLDHVTVSVGDKVASGTQLGVTNIYNHTHVQMKRGDVFLDPQEHL